MNVQKKSVRSVRKSVLQKSVSQIVHVPKKKSVLVLLKIVLHAIQDVAQTSQKRLKSRKANLLAQSLLNLRVKKSLALKQPLLLSLVLPLNWDLKS